MTNDIDKKTLDGELQLDELKEAAGGRYLTGNELDGYFEIDTWIQCKRKDLLSKCRKAEAEKLSNALNDAFGQWKTYVKGLPEGSAEVDFNCFFKSKYGDLLKQYGYKM